MEQEALHKTPITEIQEPIIRRLGIAPTHEGCHCPRAWEPFIENEAGQFAIRAEVQVLSDTERNDITNQVQNLEKGDGSGGLAEYEEFGVVPRDTLLHSLAIVCIKAGVEILPDGSVQPPLFSLSAPAPLLRWNINVRQQ